MIIKRGCIDMPLRMVSEHAASLIVTGRRDGQQVPFSLFVTCNDRALVARYALALPCDSDIEPYSKVTDGRWSFGSSLKAQQKPVTDACLKLLRDKHGCTMNVPCGGGKTVMALYIMSVITPKQVLVLVDQRLLAEQWAMRIRQFLPKASFSFILPKPVQNKIFARMGLDRKATVKGDLSGDIVIGTLQSFTALEGVSEAQPLAVDMIVCDEAHIMSAPKFNSAIWQVNYKYSLALTATVDRADKLERVFLSALGPDIVSMDVETKIATVVMLGIDTPVKDEDHIGLWCRSRGKMTTKYDCSRCDGSDCKGTSDRCVRGGKLFETSLYRRLISAPGYAAAVHKNIELLYERGYHIIVFTKLVAHAEQLFDTFVRKYGEDAVSLCCGAVPKKAALVAFKARITVCTYHIAQKGLDVPHKDAIVMALPLSDVRQAKGRIERPFVGKKNPLLLDFVVLESDMLKGMARKRYYKYYKNACPVKFVNMDESDLRWQRKDTSLSIFAKKRKPV